MAAPGVLPEHRGECACKHAVVGARIGSTEGKEALLAETLGAKKAAKLLPPLLLAGARDVAT